MGLEPFLLLLTGDLSSGMARCRSGWLPGLIAMAGARGVLSKMPAKMPHRSEELVRVKDLLLVDGSSVR